MSRFILKTGLKGRRCASRGSFLEAVRHDFEFLMRRLTSKMSLVHPSSACSVLDLTLLDLSVGCRMAVGSQKVSLVLDMKVAGNASSLSEGSSILALSRLSLMAHPSLR